MSKPARLLGPAAVTLAFALASPAAPAMPPRDAPIPVHHSAPAATLHVASSDASPAPSGTSFDWGSAAVGAGGVLALVALISVALTAAGRARVTTTR